MLADCVFCKIITRQIPAPLIIEKDDLIVIKDISPKATYHYLIIPKQHVANILALTNCELPMGASILLAAQELAKINDLSDFRLISNNGLGAGQSVFHLHFHFLAGKNLPSF